jgi:hypothetical protein
MPGKYFRGFVSAGAQVPLGKGVPELDSVAPGRKPGGDGLEPRARRRKLKLEAGKEVDMRASASARSRGYFLKLLAAAMVGAMAASGEKEAGAQVPAGDCSDLRVIQGRITAIEGSVLTVKTPDGFPGGPGVHAQFVTRGPSFRINLAACRILHPDGQQDDRQPLAVGERVVVVFNQAQPGAEAGGTTYAAAVVERVSTSDRVVTH